MAASESPSRRRRYSRQAPQQSLLLGPREVLLLSLVARYRIVSLPQLALRISLSPKRTRDLMRRLYDAGLVDVVAIPRAALADPDSANNPGLAFGSAPNLYTVTSSGQRLLVDEGLLDRPARTPRFGPKNTLFLAHFLETVSLRIWLERCADSHPGHELEVWKGEESAAIDLKRSQPPRVLRPDAIFVYRLGRTVLPAFVEIDRATERGLHRWREKIAGFQALFTSGRLVEVIGYRNARVLVVAPSVRRQRSLADLLRQHAPVPLQALFWLTHRGALSEPSLSSLIWQQPGSQLLRALVPPDVPPPTSMPLPPGQPPRPK